MLLKCRKCLVNGYPMPLKCHKCLPVIVCLLRYHAFEDVLCDKRFYVFASLAFTKIILVMYLSNQDNVILQVNQHVSELCAGCILLAAPQHIEFKMISVWTWQCQLGTIHLWVFYSHRSLCCLG